MQHVLETARKIRTMEVRGAGRIAREAAEALMDYALSLDARNLDEFNSEIERAGEILLNTRPTAVSLYNAVQMVTKHKANELEYARQSVVGNAKRFIENSEKAVERIGEIGSRRILNGDTVLTHCNSMAAISLISTAFRAGKDIRVIATESRPRNQGILTIEMMDELGIPTTLIVDSAVRSVMNNVDLVVVGADVITANGSLVNKIGTAQIALIAHEARTSFIVAAETYKFSPRTILGELVPIEERSPEEVLPDISKYEHIKVHNPAFDVTPHQYIDLICTEVGAIPPMMSYMIIRERLGWELNESAFDSSSGY
ncbi:MAG: ribose 1,5-bisphosphate isomerase [Methanotrichaceae archaeon]|nr:ribose 1,5-bisphosphate isomerase [Methanotrichaceae archaeon]